ncbi:MAG: Hsp20/alpha crystallin family protein [Spirochaetes bacterium]|jgi:HSP20 family protein|nr:Hsp20/alpha crystallin family protein [Spirochaetota bacterium]
MLTTYNVLQDINSLLESFIEPRHTVHELSNVDFEEKEGEITVKYLVPGAKIEDIDIQLENNTLKVSYDRKNDTKEHRYIRKERTSNRFARTIKLPYKVDGDAAAASLKEGVLRIVLKKSPDALPKKITIK